MINQKRRKKKETKKRKIQELFQKREIEKQGRLKLQNMEEAQ